jgi:hypothetical protein
MKNMVREVKNVRASLPPSDAKKRIAPKPVGGRVFSEIQKQKRRLTSAKAYLHRKQHDASATVMGGTRPYSNPAVIFVPGNSEKRGQAREWLQMARSVLEEKESKTRRRKQESYGQIVPGMPGKHVYHSSQFCSMNLLEKDCKAIKVLTDAVYKKDLEECHNMDGFVNDGDCFLRNVADAALGAIVDSWTFLGPAMSIMETDQQDEWRRRFASLREIPSASEFIDANKETLVCPYKFTFRAVNLHDQTEGTQFGTSAYYKHKDKIGKIVFFYSLAGESYNFVATPPPHKKRGGAGKKAHLEHTHGHDKYQMYKRSLNRSDLSLVQKFEKDFLKEAEEKGQTSVRVYKLNCSDQLIFNATEYLHATIIPKGRNGERRALLVFHELIPYK